MRITEFSENQCPDRSLGGQEDGFVESVNLEESKNLET